MNASTAKAAQQDDQRDKDGKTADKPAGQPAANDHPAEIAHPKPASHSDDERSRMPERGDQSREQSPADRPGKKPGEGEPPVG